MSWNYRVLRLADSDGTHLFAVHEVYYDEAGAITKWTAQAMCPQGSTFDELTREYEAYQKAFQEPVLAVESDGLYEIGPMGNSRAPTLAYKRPESPALTPGESYDCPRCHRIHVVEQRSVERTAVARDHLFVICRGLRYFVGEVRR